MLYESLKLDTQRKGVGLSKPPFGHPNGKGWRVHLLLGFESKFMLNMLDIVKQISIEAELKMDTYTL